MPDQACLAGILFVLKTGIGWEDLPAEMGCGNWADVTQLLPLIDALPKIAGRPGAPLSKPPEVIADRGYDSDPHR